MSIAGISRVAALIVGAVVSFSACSAQPQGLDQVLDASRDKATFFESCGQALSDIQKANPKEFAALKEAEEYGLAFDLSQPREQMRFASAAPYMCQNLLEKMGTAASEDNQALSTIRELLVWGSRHAINDAVTGLDRGIESYQSTVQRYGNNHPITERSLELVQHYLDKIQKSQQTHRILTGKNHGPEHIEVPGDIHAALAAVKKKP